MFDADFSAVVGVSGTATISVRPDNRRAWVVSQASTELANAPSGSTCTLRKNGSLITTMVAAGDVAEGAPPIRLGTSDVMTIAWAGCSPGSVAKVYLVFDYEEAPA